ncbi:MAG TPA: triose-phosphate isomerase [Tissierellaceae bacterium]
MRKPIIAGNWKMNKTIKESLDMIEELKSYDLDKNVEKVLCVPFLSLKDMKKACEGTDIKIGAQNMHWEESGAFTGEVSPIMLKELDIDYVIIGHSERRLYFNETDETVNKKVLKALEYNINPIMCVGETLEEKEAGNEKEVVKNQIVKGLKDVPSEEVEKIVVAYEPIWAIGTGKTASSDDANEMIGYIRQIIEEIYNNDVKEKVRIQYGGSVKPSNVSELMKKEEIDGALVGGASLNAQDFKDLVNY